MEKLLDTTVKLNVMELMVSIAQIPKRSQETDLVLVGLQLKQDQGSYLQMSSQWIQMQASEGKRPTDHRSTKVWLPHWLQARSVLLGAIGYRLWCYFKVCHQLLDLSVLGMLHSSVSNIPIAGSAASSGSGSYH